MTLQGFLWNANKCSAECSDVPSDNVSQTIVSDTPKYTQHRLGQPHSDVYLIYIYCKLSCMEQPKPEMS